MQDEMETNENIQEYLFNEILDAIYNARKGEMELSIKDIATAISQVIIDPEELESLIKELNEIRNIANPTTNRQ
jgi:hypothetical protein